MKAIVTGGAGFIGSHLVDELLSYGAQVHVIDNLSSGYLRNVNENAQLHIVDIRSKDAREIIEEVKPDALFHLAAQADVGKSVKEPMYDGEVNIIGTINLLEACVAASVKKFIFSSTSAVYGNINCEQITEDALTIPSSYYGLSKLTAESYVRLFNQLYDLPYTILRYANVYGPRQLPKGEGGVVSVFLERIQQGCPVNIHGDGEQTRDFVFVQDVVQGNIVAVNQGNLETFHISSATKTSVNDIVTYLSEIHGTQIEKAFTHPRIGDIKHSFLSNDKAQKILGWKPKKGPIRGLEGCICILPPIIKIA